MAPESFYPSMGFARPAGPSPALGFRISILFSITLLSVFFELQQWQLAPSKWTSEIPHVSTPPADPLDPPIVPPLRSDPLPATTVHNYPRVLTPPPRFVGDLVWIIPLVRWVQPSKGFSKLGRGQGFP